MGDRQTDRQTDRDLETETETKRDVVVVWGVFVCVGGEGGGADVYGCDCGFEGIEWE